MEPLSISAAIMTFLGSTYTLCSHVERFIEIPSSVSKLKRAVQQFECELEGLSRRSVDPNLAKYLKKSYVQDLIARAEQDLEKPQSAVAEVSRLQEHRLKVRRFKWVRNNVKYEGLRSDLEEAIKTT